VETVAGGVVQSPVAEPKSRHMGVRPSRMRANMSVRVRARRLQATQGSPVPLVRSDGPFARTRIDQAGRSVSGTHDS
jgi:hypothetical protein